MPGGRPTAQQHALPGNPATNHRPVRTECLRGTETSRRAAVGHAADALRAAVDIREALRDSALPGKFDVTTAIAVNSGPWCGDTRPHPWYRRVPAAGLTQIVAQVLVGGTTSENIDCF